MQHAALHLRQRVGHLVPQQVDLSRHQIGDGRVRAAIGDEGRLEAEHIAHHDRAEMAVGADAAMREVRAGALRLDPGDEIRRLLSGDRLAPDQQHRRIVDEADRLKILLGVVAQIGEQAGRSQQRDMVDQDGGAVRVGARHALIRARAAGAYHVFDHDGLAERPRHLVADQACDGVGAAAGRIRHHQRDGAGRIVVGERRASDHEKEPGCEQRSPVRQLNH